MFPGAKIIVIDDDEDDLKAAVAALRTLGLACISYRYPDELPEKSFGGVRLFICDINLLGADSPGDEGRALAPVISLIERVISEDNGPYALITWSTTNLHNALVQRVSQTASLSNRQPFFATFLSKAELQEHPDKLVAAIKDIFSKEAPFGALLNWESDVSKAGERVLHQVEVFSSSFPGDTPTQKMDAILSKLAVDAFGQQHVEAHRFEAVNEALFPLLGDALNSQFFNDPRDGIWDKAVTRYKEDHKIDDKIIAKLNSMVILESTQGIKSYRRGAIIELSTEWVAEKAFAERFGAKPAIVEEQTLKLKPDSKPKWLLIQTQAACDFAQPRIGPIPYLLAAVIPASAKRNGKSPNSVWKSPLLGAFDGLCKEDFHLEIIHGVAISLTRQTLEAANMKVLGRLKDQIIGSISFEHHSHGSRPGFVSFR
jgi:hypothetical protein